MTTFSHCHVCRDKLEHTALFCPTCGISACSWDCYLEHVNAHVLAAQPAGRPAETAGTFFRADVGRPGAEWR